MSDPEHPVVVLPFEEAPAPKLPGAPGWAQALSDRLHGMEIRQQHDRHQLGGNVMKLQGEIAELGKKLGEEPDADGKGGRGLIGDLRKVARDVASLMDLRSKGVGAAAAVALFGALIILGIIHWIQSLQAAR